MGRREGRKGEYEKDVSCNNHKMFHWARKLCMWQIVVTSITPNSVRVMREAVWGRCKGEGKSGNCGVGILKGGIYEEYSLFQEFRIKSGKEVIS